MKTIAVLTLLTGLLIVAGFQTGAFLPRNEAGNAVANRSETNARCSCCEHRDADSRSAAKSGEGDADGSRCRAQNEFSGECCAADSAETATGTCQGECSTGGGTCCQENDASENVMAAVSTASGVATPNYQEEAGDGDWPMWGGTPDRNMVSEATNIDDNFDLREGTHVAWSATLGSQTYGNAIVAGGKVLVGTNNGGGYRADIHPADQDKGVVLCFDEKSGEFQWQLTREKLTIGRVCDWPLQGICSTPAVAPGDSEEEGWRAWVVTNRGELMCLDLEGMKDGNDGPYTEEVDVTDKDADIIWSLDMIDELGVFPHNLATSSPLIYGDRVYVITSNGVDEAHLELPAPRAPTMLCVDKNTGELLWEQGYPEDRVLHGQWSSPSMGDVNGQVQIYFPAGDGWLYALNPDDGETIWKFDLNPKETVWELGGLGSRNNVISTAVFYDNSVIVGVGQDPEHGEGVGHLWRIDATKTGDVSAETGEIGQPGQPNPNSAVIWHYGGVDASGDVTGKPNGSIYRRTISTVAVTDDLVFAPDLSGFVHCIDLKSGKRNWEYDAFSAIWGSPMVVDGRVFLGLEDGKLLLLKATKEEPIILKQYDTVNYSSVYSTPTIANRRMFITDRTRLYAVDLGAGE